MLPGGAPPGYGSESVFTTHWTHLLSELDQYDRPPWTIRLRAYPGRIL